MIWFRKHAKLIGLAVMIMVCPFAYVTYRWLHHSVSQDKQNLERKVIVNDDIEL